LPVWIRSVNQLLLCFQCDVVAFLKVDRCLVPASGKRVLTNQATLDGHPKELSGKLESLRHCRCSEFTTDQALLEVFGITRIQIANITVFTER
jgi:hypothetical protein